MTSNNSDAAAPTPQAPHAPAAAPAPVAAVPVHNPSRARWVVWTALALVVIVVHFAYVTWRIYRATVRPAEAGAVAGLPAVADPEAHRRLAAALARDGRYTEAMAHRFVALVLDLEGARALRYHPSKTPAEYVGEARLDQDGRATLAGLVARLYRHVFGAAPSDEREYFEFDAAAAGLEQHVVPD